MDFSLTNPMHMYLHKKIYQVVVALILIGGVNWFSVGLFKTDLIRLVLPLRFARILYIIVGIGSIFFLFQRDVYLPFLGETLLPDTALVERTPQNANEQVTVKTRPGGKVLYWAAEPNPNQGHDVPSWNEAYDTYQNSGVAVAGSDGVAILRIRGPPQSYKVPMKGELQPHVHFRVSNGNGFFGRVQTLFVGSGKIEGFVI